MRSLAPATVILLALALPALSQTLGDMDPSGRFGGMPPGTDRYREDHDEGGASIPLAPVGATRADTSSIKHCPKRGSRQWKKEIDEGTLIESCR